ncbi:MAG: PaaI family thioesterase [Actinomycetota bacterium]
MSTDEPTEETIAGALRDVGRQLHAREVREEVRADVLAHLHAIDDLLAGGERRLRWYEMPEGEATRRSNRQLSTFSGRLNTVAPPMSVRSGTLADGRPALLASVRLDRRYEGPPRAVHGGIMAGMFDELLGGGQRLNGGPPGMTGRLTVRYRRPTPLDTDLELRAWIHDEREGRVTVKAECVVAEDGADDSRAAVTAEADAIFLRVDFERLERNLAQRASGETPGTAPRQDPM